MKCDERTLDCCPAGCIKRRNHFAVIDRDEMTDNAREQKLATGLRVLRRRELENYLYDPDVLKTFLSNNEKATAIDSVLAKQSQLLEESLCSYCRHEEDFARIVGSDKQSTGIVNLGNTRAEFAQQHFSSRA